MMRIHKMILSGIIGGLLGSAGFDYFHDREMLEACQKQHNVYQCKMVAVPVEKDK